MGSVPTLRLDLDVDRLTDRVAQVLRSGWITQGAMVDSLEKAWSVRAGHGYAVAVSSGQHALELALSALMAERAEDPRCVVLMPANAFVGDVMAVLRCGLMPRFVDIDESLQIDVAAAEAWDGAEEVVGVLAVHLGGWATPHLERLQALCVVNDWFLVEDACQAHGVTVRGELGDHDQRPVGSFGDATAFSFYATKLVTCGEGGMMIATRESLYRWARKARNNGSDSVYRGEATLVAGDCRLSDILAAIALEQTLTLDRRIARRAEIAARYDAALAKSSRMVPLRVPQVVPNHYKYIVVLQDWSREAALAAFEERGVACSSGIYDRPVYEHEAFADLRHVDCPVAEDLCGRHICLPIFESMTEDEIATVVAALEAL